MTHHKSFLPRLNGTMLWAIIAAVTLLSSCKSCDDTPALISADFDRKALLTAEAENVIVPAVQEYHQAMQGLKAATTDFAGAPSTNSLISCQNAWREALKKWQHVTPLRFGPAAENYIHQSANIFPVDIDQIEQNVENNTTDLDAANQMDAQGLQAIDYLLYAESNQLVIDRFTSGDLVSQRKGYLSTLVNRLALKADHLNSAWMVSEGNYSTVFANNDGIDPASSLALMLNSLLQTFERDTRTLKLGLPAGALSFSQQPVPNLVEGYYENDNSVTYLKESFEGIKNIYYGGDKVGLDDYLIAIDARYNDISLAEAIDAQITEIEASLQMLQDPLSEFVTNDQPQALQVYAELQQLIVLWKVDMMSALGVLVTFQDNDGD